MEWIKMRSGLPDDADVIRIAARLSIDEFSVCGRLLAVWAWADANTTDGFVPGGTVKRIDAKAGTEGFADAMVAVGWLTVRSDGVQFPNWEVHNSKSAKKRSQDAKRKQVERNRGKRTGQMSVSEADKCPPYDRTNVRSESGRVLSSLLSSSNTKKEEAPAEEPEGGEVAASLAAHQTVLSEFNAATGGKVHLTESRRRKLTTRLRDSWWFDNWRTAVEEIGRNPFLQGSKGWKATFEWFLKPDSVRKIVEGDYAQHSTAVPPMAPLPGAPRGSGRRDGFRGDFLRVLVGDEPIATSTTEVAS